MNRDLTGVMDERTLNLGFEGVEMVECGPARDGAIGTDGEDHRYELETVLCESTAEARLVTRIEPVNAAGQRRLDAVVPGPPHPTQAFVEGTRHTPHGFEGFQLHGHGLPLPVSR